MWKDFVCLCGERQSEGQERVEEAHDEASYCDKNMEKPSLQQRETIPFRRSIANHVTTEDGDVRSRRNTRTD